MSAPGPFLFLSGGRHPVSVLVDVNPGGKSAQRLGPSGLSLLVSWKGRAIQVVMAPWEL